MDTMERVGQVAIRRATLDDTPWFTSRVSHFNGRIPANKLFLKDRNALLNHIEDTILNHVAFVAEKDGEIVGFISGITRPHPYVTEPDKLDLLVMTHWWVEETFRGSRAGLMLLNTFTDHGKLIADRIVMSLPVESNMGPDAMEKRGYKLSERSFTMEV